MVFLDLVKIRQSVRDYTDRPVEREKINRCLEAARLAPSACNFQPWEFIVVDDLLIKDEIAKDTFGTFAATPINRFTLQTPVLILVLSDKPGILARIGGIVKIKAFNFLMDAGICAAYFCLQAAEEGLGTCTLGNFKEKRIKKRLNIPASKRIDLVIAVGYPKSNEIRPKVRKGLKQIVRYNKYQ